MKRKKILIINSWIVFITIVIVSPTWGGMGGPEGGRMKGPVKDERIMRFLKKNGIQYRSDRVSLWVEKGYLSKLEIKELASRVNTGVTKSEKFLGIKFDRERYGDDKIHYFVKSGRFISRVYGSHRQNQFKEPVVFLSYVKEKKSPYLHETIHILMWNFHSLWIREGLAVFLNNKLGGYPAFPNLGRDLDKMAKYRLGQESKAVLRLIGQDGIPDFSDRGERKTFYIFSGSFVKFLEIRLGIKRLKELYEQKSMQDAFIGITGKSVDEWKQEWVNRLKSTTFG